MQSLEERAKSYAKQSGAAMPELCAFDYIAGAEEERILLTGWKKVSEAQDAEMDWYKQYLLRIKCPEYAVVTNGQKYWYEVCRWMAGEFCIHGKYMSVHREKAEWREIYETDM